MPTAVPLSWMIGLTLPAQADAAASRHTLAINQHHCFTLKVRIARSPLWRRQFRRTNHRRSLLEVRSLTTMSREDTTRLVDTLWCRPADSGNQAPAIGTPTE